MNDMSTAAREVTSNPGFVPIDIEQTKLAATKSADDTASDMAGLMRAVGKHRSRAAFQQIFHHFAPQVKAFLINRGLTPAVADDVLQEVMLGVWKKAGSYDPAKAKVNTWIFTIARYKYIDRLRHDGRRKTESEDFHSHASDDMQSHEGVFQAQSQDAVKVAITNLPEEQQAVIFLSFMKGLSHSEIAEQLTLPLGTVKSRIRRAFAQLREELTELNPALCA
jgi:RNA polymerase sigma-70 factor (ECF subfamily)